MLYFTFVKPDDYIRDASLYFKHHLDMSILNDEFVKTMIKDVDKTDVVSEQLLISPVFGPIPPSKLSGGVQALILMYAQDKPVWATACGDNCAKWIVEIAKKKDVKIVLGHRMNFPEAFEAVSLDTGDYIHSDRDFAIQWLYTKGYTKEDFND